MGERETIGGVGVLVFGPEDAGGIQESCFGVDGEPLDG